MASTFPLMRLPTELRVRILMMVVAIPDERVFQIFPCEDGKLVYRLSKTDKFKWCPERHRAITPWVPMSSTGLLCRELTTLLFLNCCIHEELTYALYTTVTFRFTGPGDVARFCSMIGPRNCSSLRKVQLAFSAACYIRCFGPWDISEILLTGRIHPTNDKSRMPRGLRKYNKYRDIPKVLRALPLTEVTVWTTAATNAKSCKPFYVDYRWIFKLVAAELPGVKSIYVATPMWQDKLDEVSNMPWEKLILDTTVHRTSIAEDAADTIIKGLKPTGLLDAPHTHLRRLPGDPSPKHWLLPKHSRDEEAHGYSY